MSFNDLVFFVFVDVPKMLKRVRLIKDEVTNYRATFSSFFSSFFTFVFTFVFSFGFSGIYSSSSFSSSSITSSSIFSSSGFLFLLNGGYTFTNLTD